jgi:hypothetical protein
MTKTYSLFINQAKQTDQNLLALLPEPAKALGALLDEKPQGDTLLIAPSQRGIEKCLEESTGVRSDIRMAVDRSQGAREMDFDLGLVAQPASLDRIWFRELYAPRTMTGTQFIVAGNTTRSTDESAVDTIMQSGAFDLFYELD